jgi:hypothetical protein
VQVRHLLRTLIEPRNCLAHGNVIAVRSAEQVICYTGDVIASLKGYYAGMNMASQYNVPQFIKAIDSLGNVKHFEESPNKFHLIRFIDSNWLYVGDTLSIQLEVDPSFPSSGWTIEWQAPPGSQCNGAHLVLQLDDRHINAELTFFCKLISTNSWHKYGTYDHQLVFIYRVLPPG